MSPRFTPRQLEAFIAAAELSNFAAAARRLNLVPSAISSLINELEASLGFSLFERTTRKVTLTAAGRQFLPSALAVQRQIGHAATAAADIRQAVVDIVRVAAPMAIASTVLPKIIARYGLHRPRTVVRVIDTGVEWLADRVAMGEADLALGPDRTVQADIARVELFPSPWVVWCSPAHPFAARTHLTWRDLLDTDVYAAGHDHEHSILPRLPEGSDAARVAPVQVVEYLSTALGMAAAGLGVTFSPDYVEPFARALGLVMRPLIDPVVTRTVCLYAPAQRAPTMAVAEFRSFLERHAADAIASRWAP
ncbi:MAG: LysR family transcriptional regulator [Caulobacter sp.]|nr:LysR family transcriptional regulator [Caulobacter sp.]